MGHSDGWLEGADSDEDDSSLPRPSALLAPSDFDHSAGAYTTMSHGQQARSSRRPSASTATSGAASGLTDTEASRLVRRAEKYKKRCTALQAQLEESRANARAAALEVGRAEERASEATGRVDSVAERQRQAEAECQSLRQALDKRGMEVRELRYRNLHLARELAQTKEAATESERTAREGMRAIRGSLADAERALLTRTKGLRAEHRTLQSLVEALEQHTQRGMHIGPTATAQQLFIDLWRSLGAMARTVDNVGRAVTGITPAADTTRRRRARPEGGEDGEGDVPGGYAEGERQLLAETMSDLCGDLEAENRQMRAEIEVLREQVAEAHRRAEAASLVPQYRLAVVRSRAQAAALRQRTAEQERLMDALRDRVTDLEGRLREETSWRMEAVQERGDRLRRVAKEQEAYRATYADVGRSFPPPRGRSASTHSGYAHTSAPLVPDNDPGWQYWPRPSAGTAPQWYSSGAGPVARSGATREPAAERSRGGRESSTAEAAAERRRQQQPQQRQEQRSAAPVEESAPVGEPVDAWVRKRDMDAPGVTQLDRMLLGPAEAEDAGAEADASEARPEDRQQTQPGGEGEEREIQDGHQPKQQPQRRRRRRKQSSRARDSETTPQHLREHVSGPSSGDRAHGDDKALRALPPASVLHAAPARPLPEQEASAVLSPAAVGRGGSGSSSSSSGSVRGGKGSAPLSGTVPAQAWATVQPVTVPSPPASSSASAATDAGSVALRTDLARLDGEIIALQHSLRATTAQLSQHDTDR